MYLLVSSPLEILRSLPWIDILVPFAIIYAGIAAVASLLCGQYINLERMKLLILYLEMEAKL